MRITLRILRSGQTSESSPAWQDYEVEATPTDRILDTLLAIQDHQDPTLGLRKSCGHGVCGSDAMVINGASRLACKTLVRDVAETEGAVITIEPMRHLPVLRDLIVDQSEFFARYRLVSPFLIAEPVHGERERLQTPEERAKIDDPTNCILCGACVSACPRLDEVPQFIGPAAIVQAARFNDDSRDEGFPTRLGALDTPNGVWPCANYFACTRSCPRHIKITRLINLTKRRIERHKAEHGTS